ncbi:uncharacterized protein PRCAT00006255001 [Priceomyces carsonii]|uniref:uncharacterized protein n=1 Tax=Priceomyces carsonii TaxID=28549 RepID=UPI002ED7B891|nr:unnamed protein product [Priceomyces carsonii]
MSVDDTLPSYLNRLQSINSDIRNYFDSLSVDNIINDPNLKVSTVPLANVDELASLSLNQLYRKVPEIEQSISVLDQLWYIRGYVKETESLLEINEDLDLSDLESIVANSEKLRSSIESLSDSSVIKTELQEKQHRLAVRFSEVLNGLYNRFVPDNSTFITKLDNDLSYFELLNVANNFEFQFNMSTLKVEFQESRVNWDKLLSGLLNKSFNLTLKSDNDRNTLNKIEYTTSIESYFQSIISFIEFINLLRDQTIKNFFRSKIASNLINTISENINQFIGTRKAVTEFERLIELSKTTGWNLLPTFNSSARVKGELNKLYLNWIVDKYIDKTRQVYNENVNELIADLVDEPVTEKYNQQAKNDNDDENGAEDDWNKGWDDDSNGSDAAVDEEDGWNNDDWDNDDWDKESVFSKESKKKKSKEGHSILETNSLVKISKVPERLIEIFTDYRSSTSNHDETDLITTIKALSLVSYPPLTQSFVLLNDFIYLSNVLHVQEFSSFATSSWDKTSMMLKNELKSIILSIDLNHEEFTDELDDYELSDDILNKLAKIYQIFSNLLESDLNFTNHEMFKQFLISSIELLNNSLLNSIIQMNEITELQSIKFTKTIEQLNNITIPYLQSLNVAKDSVASYNKLENLLFLINHHLSDIMDRFYQGEFFDFDTYELISVIESVFIKSELRNSYVREIEETRETI